MKWNGLRSFVLIISTSDDKIFANNEHDKTTSSILNGMFQKAFSRWIMEQSAWLSTKYQVHEQRALNKRLRAERIKVEVSEYLLITIVQHVSM